MRAYAASVLLLSCLTALAGCAGNDGAGIPSASSESDYTGEEAGAQTPRSDTDPTDPAAPATTDPDAGTPAPAAPAAITPVPAYADADIGLKPRLRFAIDNGAPVEGAGVTLDIVVSGADRRFKVTGGTPGAASSRPVVYTEFGKGTALIEPGTYDCATLQAVVLMVKPDGSKLSTVQPGAQRRCQVIVDQAKDVTTPGNGLVRAIRRVTAHFDADLGPHQSVGGTEATVAGAIAGVFTELKLP